MITSRVASVKLVRRASIRFIILFRVRPKLADWKSAVLGPLYTVFYECNNVQGKNLNN